MPPTLRIFCGFTMTELPTLITVRYVHDVGHVLDVYEDVRHVKYLVGIVTSSDDDDSDNGIIYKMKGKLVRRKNNNETNNDDDDDGNHDGEKDAMLVSIMKLFVNELFINTIT